MKRNYLIKSNQKVIAIIIIALFFFANLITTY